MSSKNWFLPFILIFCLLVVAPPIPGAASPDVYVKFGTYGTLAQSGQLYQLSAGQAFADSKLDWIWLQPPYPYSQPTKSFGSLLKSANKKIILRTFFWDAPGLSGRYKTWTDLYNSQAAYQICLTAIKQQIDNLGSENLYAVTISEEEPAIGYEFNKQNVNFAHYNYGNNLLYDKLKLLYPGLKILGTAHPLNWLTDQQVIALKMDGIFVYSYASDTVELGNYLSRGVRLANLKSIQSEVYTLIYASTGNTREPPGDPGYITPAFYTALQAGITNIGFYASNYEVSGNSENILLNSYSFDPRVDARLSPYLHQVVMQELIDQYSDPASWPSLPQATPPPINTPELTAVPTPPEVTTIPAPPELTAVPNPPEITAAPDPPAITTVTPNPAPEFVPDYAFWVRRLFPILVILGAVGGPLFPLLPINVVISILIAFFNCP